MLLILLTIGAYATAAGESQSLAVEPNGSANDAGTAGTAGGTATAGASSSGALLSLAPGVRRVVLELGSNDTPLIPTDDDALTLAFEPMLDVAARIARHPRVRVVPAAVSADGRGGLATMRQYNEGSVSSSLTAPAARASWNDDASRGDGSAHVVPLLPLAQVLGSLPHGVELSLIKTDMQGADFGALRSVGRAALRRAQWLWTEMWVDNVRTYAGADNDFCRDYLPLMRAWGFKLVQLKCEGFEVPTCGIHLHLHLAAFFGSGF